MFLTLLFDQPFLFSFTLKKFLLIRSFTRNPVLFFCYVWPLLTYLDDGRVHEDTNYIVLLGFRMVFKRAGSKTCLQQMLFHALSHSHLSVIT